MRSPSNGLFLSLDMLFPSVPMRKAIILKAKISVLQVFIKLNELEELSCPDRELSEAWQVMADMAIAKRGNLVLARQNGE